MERRQSTTRAGPAAVRDDSDTDSEHERQEAVMLAQRKACRSVLELMLMLSSCCADLRLHLPGLGSRKDMSDQTLELRDTESRHRR